MFNQPVIDACQRLSDDLKQQSKRISTAESCTGGLIAAVITELPGSSDIFDRGYITYSNHAKIELLNVPTYFIDEYGAVSKETALAMAEGALLLSRSDIAISVTGIAGPSGGTDTKPVGTVYLGCAVTGKATTTQHLTLCGDRRSIREQTIICALAMATHALT